MATFRTGVRASFTPITARTKIVGDSVKFIGAARADIQKRSTAALVELKTEPPPAVHYIRTHRYVNAWKLRLRDTGNEAGVQIVNDVQGTNWSGESGVRYAQFVVGTITDPGRQGPYQQAWPLFVDIINRNFEGAANNKSLAYARFQQGLLNRELT